MSTTRITTPEPTPRRLFAPVLLVSTLALLAGLFALSPPPAAAEGPQPPGPVASLLLEASTDSVTATWQAPESGGAPKSYIVHLKPEGGGKGKTRRPKADKTSVTFRNLESGATYRVFVRGKNAAGKGQRTWGSITLPELEPEPQQQDSAKTFSITSTASTAEGADATLTITLSEVAPTGGIAFTVTAGYSDPSTAVSGDVGSITSPVTVTEGNDTLEIAIPTADDHVDEDNETFTVTVATAASGWVKAGDGKDTATVTITDDDTAGVTVLRCRGATYGYCSSRLAEVKIKDVGFGSYWVFLDSKPTANVIITASSSDPGAARVTPRSQDPDSNRETKLFTPDTWRDFRWFLVFGVPDADTNDETVAVSFAVTSDDPDYNGISVPDLTVTVKDTTPDPD